MDMRKWGLSVKHKDMASNLQCPECHEDLGKDTECDALEYCGNCGEDNIYNERGDTDNLSEEQLSMFKNMKRKRSGGRLINRL